MNRRRVAVSLALGAIVIAVFAVHTLDSPAPHTEDTPQVTELPRLELPSPAALTTVTLPPPPASAGSTIEPLTPAPPTQEIAPLETPSRAPAAASLKPLAAEPEPTANPSRARAEPVEIKPLAAEADDRPAPAEQRPAPVKPDETPALVQRVSDTTVRQAGRPLLRLLEHGEGPTVEITWPDNRRARSQLHRVFSQCYGMRVAVIDGSGRLFDANSPSGVPWAINTDRFSGFVRQSSGGGPLIEQQTVMRIRNRHGLTSRAAAVRVFPRRADAVLLGGLSQLIGDGYLKARRIQADYRMSAEGVRVADVRVDGKPVPGAIDLTQAASRRCVL